MLVPRVFQKALWVLSTALSFFWASCGSSYEFYRNVDMNISQGRYAEAIEEVRENEGVYGDKSSVLFKLDMGMLFHYAGEADSSNKYFFAAEREIEDLYTKSVSLAVLSFVLNDNVLPYEGEDFEKVLINVFLALNYAEQGMTEDALVEARKVDLKLRELSRRYEGKNKYKEDAFIRYIAGVLYESDGEINDAFISYRKAFDTYRVYEEEYGTPAPVFLLDDLVRTATLMGFTDEAESYASLGGTPYEDSDVTLGSILIVAYAGRAPTKREIRPTVTIPDTSGTLHTFQIALPKFVARHSSPRVYTVTAASADDTSRTQTVISEDVTAIAGSALEDRLGLIYLKSGGRALMKFLAAEKAKSELSKDGDKKGRNFLGSLAVDLVVGAMEQADLRTWRTLPAQIQLARLNLPPGYYTVNVASSDHLYELIDVTVDVRPKRTSFVLVDDIR